MMINKEKFCYYIDLIQDFDCRRNALANSINNYLCFDSVASNVSFGDDMIYGIIELLSIHFRNPKIIKDHIHYFLYDPVKAKAIHYRNKRYPLDTIEQLYDCFITLYKKVDSI